MPLPLFILNGPNLNLLGVREPEIYGRARLADIQALCEETALTHGLSIDFRQTNHEGVLIDWIHEAREGASALILNPAAYGHTSIALHDALKPLETPVIEVHLSNPLARESFRARSYVSALTAGVISGFGAESYRLAVTAAARLIGARS